MGSYHEYMREALELSERAEREGRDMTEAEYAEARVLNDKARAVKGGVADEATVAAAVFGNGASAGVRAGGAWPPGGGLGDQFISSKQYQAIKDSASRGQTWTTGPIDLLESKATLTTTPGTALGAPQYLPGIVETLFQANGIQDLLGSDQTSSGQVRYVVESTATNAAAPTAEGAAKPESTFVFSETVEAVRKMATSLPVSDEMLEDSESIRAYLNSRLALFVSNVEEAQILLGNGTAPNLAGLITRTGPRTIGTYVRSAGTSNTQVILQAAVATRGSSQLEPTFLVIHPDNWLQIRGGTDTSGQYFGGGPFYGQYGAGGVASMFGQPVWGLTTLVTSNITKGTALIGSRLGASVVRRRGITVEATNSHGTLFVSNITTLRAESRLALAVYRPSAFCAITGLA